MIPGWVNDLYKDILEDDGLLKLYNNMPVQCLAESVCSIGVPGAHLKLIEQTHPSANHAGDYKTYYPQGDNAMSIIDDNELAIQFRLIDGFHNYNMLYMALTYMGNDSAQSAQGETYKDIGTVVMEFELSPKWKLQRHFRYCVYSSINGNDFSFDKRAQEAGFTVRLKFTEHVDYLYCDGKCMSERAYNHNLGN